MEMERQQPSRTPEGNRPRDKDHGTRSMGQILSREDQPQESRRRTISFSSEEPYRRFFGMEILDHGENAVDLSRLNSVGVLLFNHNIDKVVGKVIRAWVENHRGMAEEEFDTDDDAEKIFGKVQSGNNFKQGGFSGSVNTNQTDFISLVDCKGTSIQKLAVAVTFGKVFCVE